MQYKVFVAELPRLLFNIGFPNTSNGLTFRGHLGAVVRRYYLQNTFDGCFIHGNTKFLERSTVYVGMVGIIHGGAYFRGLITFKKLKHYTRVVEASILTDYKVNF